MQQVRVLVVDDSVVVRRLVSEALASDPGIDVVGTAVDGQAALMKTDLLSPDLITMDIEMPRLDGVGAVRALRQRGCTIPIVMFSTLTEHGATATLDALAAGATDYVTKPANVGSVTQSQQQIRSRLIPLIKALVPRSTPRQPPRTVAPPSAPRPVPALAGTAPVRLVVVASSTGGPEALSTLLTALPVLPVPVAVVQHMPPVFTAQLASRLDRLSALRVTEASHDVPMAPGTVHLAPGDHHLVVAGRGDRLRAGLHQAAPENFCRPAADVLFRSAAQVVGGGTLAVVLTGMGQDGCRGADEIVAAGGAVLAQDAATSVVWGMPGAVAEAGLADEVLPLSRLAAAIQQRVTRVPSLVPHGRSSR